MKPGTYQGKEGRRWAPEILKQDGQYAAHKALSYCLSNESPRDKGLKECSGTTAQRAAS